MTGPLVFLDTETTGLHPARQAWEIAMIRRPEAGSQLTMRRHLFVRVSMDTAEPKALEVGRYSERFDPDAALSRREAARNVYDWTAGAVIVGSNPQFDLHTLGRLLRAYGYAPAWHYRPLCVATLAAGYLGGYSIAGGRFSSYKVSRALGVEPPAPDVAHTAMGDAEWAMRLFDRITGTEGDEL